MVLLVETEWTNNETQDDFLGNFVVISLQFYPFPQNGIFWGGGSSKLVNVKMRQKTLILKILIKKEN